MELFEKFKFGNDNSVGYDLEFSGKDADSSFTLCIRPDDFYKRSGYDVYNSKRKFFANFRQEEIIYKNLRYHGIEHDSKVMVTRSCKFVLKHDGHEIELFGSEPRDLSYMTYKKLLEEIKENTSFEELTNTYELSDASDGNYQFDFGEINGENRMSKPILRKSYEDATCGHLKTKNGVLTVELIKSHDSLPSVSSDNDSPSKTRRGSLSYT